jgi:hypothetical protein
VETKRGARLRADRPNLAAAEAKTKENGHRPIPMAKHGRAMPWSPCEVLAAIRHGAHPHKWPLYVSSDRLRP